MHILVALIVLAALVGWVYAECRLGRVARIAFGLIGIAASAGLTLSLCQTKHFYENGWHRSSIKAAQRLLVRGETNAVISAFENYTSTSAKEGTFRASEQMMQAFRRAEAE